MSEMQSISPTLANQLVIENEFKQRLIERTKNYGITKKPDGKTTYSCKLSFDGSIDNAIRSEGRMRFGAEEAVRLYNLGRKAWLKGDFETVADMFGVLV